MDEEDLKILYIIAHCELCEDTLLLESPIPYVLCSRCEEIGNRDNSVGSNVRERWE